MAQASHTKHQHADNKRGTSKVTCGTRQVLFAGTSVVEFRVCYSVVSIASASRVAHICVSHAWYSGAFRAATQFIQSCQIR